MCARASASRRSPVESVRQWLHHSTTCNSNASTVAAYFREHPGVGQFCDLFSCKASSCLCVHSICRNLYWKERKKKKKLPSSGGNYLKSSNDANVAPICIFFHCSNLLAFHLHSLSSFHARWLFRLECWDAAILLPRLQLILFPSRIVLLRGRQSVWALGRGHCQCLCLCGLSRRGSSLGNSWIFQLRPATQLRWRRRAPLNLQQQEPQWKKSNITAAWAHSSSSNNEIHSLHFTFS